MATTAAASPDTWAHNVKLVCSGPLLMYDVHIIDKDFIWKLIYTIHINVHS